jgi:hypothetical protein
MVLREAGSVLTSVGIALQWKQQMSSSDARAPKND